MKKPTKGKKRTKVRDQIQHRRQVKDPEQNKLKGRWLHTVLFVARLLMDLSDWWDWWM